MTYESPKEKETHLHWKKYDRRQTTDDRRHIQCNYIKLYYVLSMREKEKLIKDNNNLLMKSISRSRSFADHVWSDEEIAHRAISGK